MLYRICGILILGLLAVFLLTGCGAYATAPVTGVLISDVSAPVAVGMADKTPSKHGESSVTSIFGLFAWGDASIKAAVSKASIKKIYWVDYQSVNVLGLYSKYIVHVYGE